MPAGDFLKTHDPILAAFDALVATRASDTLMVSTRERATVGDIERLAKAIHSLAVESGLAPGNIVGLAAPNGPAFAAGYLGLRRAGFKVLLMDRGTPHQERRRIEQSLQSAGSLVLDTGWPSSADAATLNLDVETNPLDIPDAVSTIRLTSGSTGQPRGIAMTSEALLKDDSAIRSTMELENERALAAIPLSHSYGFSSLFLPALTQGWLLAIPSGISPFAAVEIASESRITFLPTVPAYIEALLKMETPPSLPTTLQKIITAGAPLKSEAARRFREIFGQPIHVFYGASEVGGICYDRRGDAAERGTLGTPLDGVEVLLAPEPGLGDGQGIVEVLSPATAVGYIPDDDKSLGSDRYLTSDIGAFLDGELLLFGRVDAIVNVRGKKVDPREVETVLNALGGIDETIVMGIQGPSSSGEFLGAIVAGDQTMPQVDGIRDWCRQHLASHKIPRHIVRVEALPRTSRGKVNRKLIRQWLTRTSRQ